MSDKLIALMITIVVFAVLAGLLVLILYFIDIALVILMIGIGLIPVYLIYEIVLKIIQGKL